MKAVPISGEAQYWAVQKVMGGDAHSCPFPTHTLINDAGEIVGAFSVKCAPVLFFWMDSTRHNAIAAARAYALAEQEMRELGCSQVILQVEKTSPFYEYIPKIGYDVLGDVTMFRKQLAP